MYSARLKLDTPWPKPAGRHDVEAEADEPVEVLSAAAREKRNKTNGIRKAIAVVAIVI